MAGRPTHLVLRVISGPGGRDIYAGSLVDASQWANRRLLEGAGKIRRLRPDELAKAAEKPAAEETRKGSQRAGRKRGH
jgi:hypothetical protein